MSAPRSLSQAVQHFPASLDVVGNPDRGLLSILIDTNDVALQDIVITVDLGYILLAKLAAKLL